MSPSPPQFWFRLIVPAAAGMIAGVFVIPKQEPSRGGEGFPSPDARSQREVLRPLPDDPAVLKMAAYGGRTKEAREALAKALAAGAPVAELADWLAPVLAVDPGWCDAFLKTVPEVMRAELMARTLTLMGEGPCAEAGWEVVRQSPEALKLMVAGMQKKGGIHSFPLPGIEGAACEAVLFDPASGFTSWNLATICQEGRPARRLLEEWRAGRLEARKAMNVLWYAWSNLRDQDPAGLERLMKDAPEEIGRALAGFEVEARLGKKVNDAWAELRPGDLGAIQRPGGVMEVLFARTDSGQPVPLEFLEELPSSESSRRTRSGYLSRLLPEHVEMVGRYLEGLDASNLTSADKDSLFEAAGRSLYDQTGDIGKALDWIARMPSAEKNWRVIDSVLVRYINDYPEQAREVILSHVPEGERRETLMGIVEACLP